MADSAAPNQVLNSTGLVGSSSFSRPVLTEKLGTDFTVEPWHGVVERTFACLENARYLGRDDEELPEHHRGFVRVAMIRLTLCKLAANRRT